MPGESIASLLTALSRDYAVQLQMQDGVCGVEFANGVRVALAVFDDAEELLHFFSPVRSLNEESPLRIVKQAMQLNFFDRALGGAWFALDDTGETIMLCLTHPTENLTYDTFEHLFLSFAELAGTAADLLSPDPQKQDSTTPPRYETSTPGSTAIFV